MRENDEFIGQVEDYLVEFDGDTPLPGRVLDAIHAELPRTRQAKARPGFMRMPPMLSTIWSRAPLGVAAAIVILAVVVGATFMNGRNDQASVGGASPAVSPAAGPSQGAGAVAGPELNRLVNAPLVPCPGITDEPQCLQPGTYQLGTTEIWPAIISLDVPENWWYYEGGTGHAGLLVQTVDAINGSGWGVIFSTVGSVSIDPCDPTAGAFDTDVHTPGELFEVIDQWPGFEATEPVPIQNGYNGVAFTLTSTKTSAECPVSVMWTTANSHTVDAYPMVNDKDRRHEVELQVFDIDGELLVVAAMNFPETSPFEEANGIPFDPQRHAGHQVDMDAILDSIKLKDPQGVSF
jgi:hypothetical protein